MANEVNVLSGGPILLFKVIATGYVTTYGSTMVCRINKELQMIIVNH